MPEALSLREHKKLKTKRQLIAVSQKLFWKQGFEATTLEQICDEVDVSVPTLLAYFPSKDRLAMAEQWEIVEQLERALDDPDRDDTLTIWRSFVVLGSERIKEDPKHFLRSVQATRSSPQLRRAALEVTSAYEAALTRGLAADFDTEPRTDLPTMLLATMLAWGNQRVAEQWVDAGGEGDFSAQAIAVVDFAIERFPRPGTGSFQKAKASKSRR